MLILVGAGIILDEASRRLAEGAHVEKLGVGIAVIGFSAMANLAVSAYLQRRARITDPPALEGDAAHLRTDAYTSVGVLVALLLVEVTGELWIDPATAMVVAAAIVVAGVRISSRTSRVLVTRRCRRGARRRSRRDREYGAEVIGFHKLGRAGRSCRYIDLHVQFRDGTSLSRAHEVAHALQGEIRAPPRRRRAHPPRAGGVGQVRFTAAAAPTASSTPE